MDNVPTLEDVMNDAKNVTDAQKLRWKLVSDVMISTGRVEEIKTPEALAQAIDRLAYEITMRSYGSYAAGLDEKQMFDVLDPDIKKLDDILYTIAFGSRIHIDIIDAMLGVRIEHHVEKIVEQIKNGKR